MILMITVNFTAPLSTNSTSESSSQIRVKFTPAEDKLVVIVPTFTELIIGHVFVVY